MQRTLAQRLFARVSVEADGCWIWTGSIRKGYGQIWTSLDASGHRSLLQAHRASYELARGPIPEGLDLDHLCRNRLCVNPDHLEPVTRRVNILRGTAPAAHNARKTHCDEGHSLVRLRNGRRGCPTCALAKRGKRLAVAEVA